MRPTPSISAVFPAFNEAENIENTVLNTDHYFKEKVSDYEIIVVNDGSTDDTESILKQLSLSVSNLVIVNHPGNMGYGAALRTGFDKASKDYILLMDSDGQFDIIDLDKFLPFVPENEVLIGYRENRADSLIRSVNAWLYHQYIILLLNLKVKDIDCAFKLFSRKAYNKIKPIKSGGALFSAEFLIKLKRNGYDLKEIPVSHFPRLFGEQSGANINVVLRMFKECWKLRNELKGL